MAAKPVLSLEELAEALRNAPAPTDDDVTVLWDGRRIDSKEAALQWLAEVDAKRAEDAAADPCQQLTDLRTTSSG
jgi:hypothetical protein